MKKFASILVCSAAALLSACGGGGSSGDAFRPAPAGGAAVPTVASVSLTVSKTSILNDGTETSDVTAFVRNSGNLLLEAVPVTFSATSGALEVRNPITAANGTSVAVLTPAGVTTPRTVTITATAGGVSGSITVQIVAAQPPIAVGTLTLSTSTPSIPSDGTLPATITAIARDTSNRFMQNVPVTFTATSGGLTVVTGTTNASGQATATLSSAADPSNRAITVTATAQAITSTLAVSVSGTRLSIVGPTSLVLTSVGTFTVALVDSADKGIPNRTVTVASARNNTLSAPSVTTDAQGRATFTATITQTGNETLTVSTLGLTANAPVSVNSDAFTFTAPVAGLEIPLSTPQLVSINWLTSGAPVMGLPVTFTATRGTLVPASGIVNTDASGNASVTVSSTTAGGALITATGGAASATRTVEFVAQTAQTIDVQSSSFAISPNEQATVTAFVRDPTGNLVKNKTVTFSLTDITGGTISVAAAITNSQGRAQTVYTAGTVPSARDGVRITATVAGASGPVTDFVDLTVARKELFISLGTGNELKELSASQYEIEFFVAVTDANGNGVAQVPVTLSVLSTNYLKGNRDFVDSWAAYKSPVYRCTDEDTLVPATARNGVLDAGEDFNNSGRLEAGNVALVTPNQVTTNAQGIAIVTIRYPQDVAYWLEVVLEARTSVQGTEFGRSTTFLLPGTAADFNTRTNAPPGPRSPFGVNACNVPN